MLALAYWEELTGPQIAKVLGCSSTAARLRLYRARKRLTRLLERRQDGPDDVRDAERRDP